MAVHESQRLKDRVNFPIQNRENPYETWQRKSERKAERKVERKGVNQGGYPNVTSRLMAGISLFSSPHGWHTLFSSAYGWHKI